MALAGMRNSFICLLFLLLFMQQSHAGQDPRQFLMKVVNNVTSELQTNKKRIQGEPDFIFQIVNRVILPHMDFGEMSKRVLATSWRKATEEQRARFQHEFATLVVRTYAAAFRNYSDEKVDVVSMRRNQADKSRVEVRTYIRRKDAPDVPVYYRMHTYGETWKVYDINVDGVSLVSNFRSQFKSSISQQGLKAVIDEIATHNRKKIQWQ